MPETRHSKREREPNKEKERYGEKKGKKNGRERKRQIDIERDTRDGAWPMVKEEFRLESTAEKEEFWSPSLRNRERET